jgi:hypothetical protein
MTGLARPMAKPPSYRARKPGPKAAEYLRLRLEMTPPSPSRTERGKSEGGDGPPVRAGGPGSLVLWLAKPLRLILNVEGNLLERR